MGGGKFHRILAKLVSGSSAVLDKVTRLVRRHDTIQSSNDIICQTLKNDLITLKIQRKLVDKGKNIKDTAAGEAVGEYISKLIRFYETEVALEKETSGLKMRMLGGGWQRLRSARLESPP